MINLLPKLVIGIPVVLTCWALANMAFGAVEKKWNGSYNVGDTVWFRRGGQGVSIEEAAPWRVEFKGNWKPGKITAITTTDGYKVQNLTTERGRNEAENRQPFIVKEDIRRRDWGTKINSKEYDIAKIENIKKLFQNDGCTEADAAVNKPGWWHYNWYGPEMGKWTQDTDENGTPYKTWQEIQTRPADYEVLLQAVQSAAAIPADPAQRRIYSSRNGRRDAYLEPPSQMPRETEVGFQPQPSWSAIRDFNMYNLNDDELIVETRESAVRAVRARDGQ